MCIRDRYEFKYGRKNVERFLDAVLAIEEHIDPYFFIKREISAAEEKRRAEHQHKDGPYDDLWLLDKNERETRELNRGDQANENERPVRERLPEKDLLCYLKRNPRDLAAIAREEGQMGKNDSEERGQQLPKQLFNKR